jgi:hypothetical protein
MYNVKYTVPKRISLQYLQQKKYLADQKRKFAYNFLKIQNVLVFI